MDIVVGVGDLKISDQPGDTLITYALGSCLGIVLYDPTICVGGLLHVMLPLSKHSPEKARRRPAMFIDTGFERLLGLMIEKGVKKENLQIYIAGGASMKQAGQEDHFRIGHRNITTIRKLLWKNGFMITSQDTGGSVSRTMALSLKDGRVTINKKPMTRINGQADQSSGRRSEHNQLSR